MAQDIMTKQHGAAKNLLYELYIALEKKRKAKFTGVAVEAMRPAATAKLKSTESGNQEVTVSVLYKCKKKVAYLHVLFKHVMCFPSTL